VSDADDHDALAEQLEGQTIIKAELDDIRDGYVVLVLDDGTSLEIRTSKVGQLLLSSRPT
jgi:hypothetical protein